MSDKAYTLPEVEEALIKVLSTCCLFQGDSDLTRKMVLAALQRLPPPSSCHHLASGPAADPDIFYEDPCKTCGQYVVDDND